MVSADSKIKIRESRPIDRFRNQGKVLERFGEVGISVYEAVVEGLNAGAIAQRLGVPVEKVLEILSFMESSGMLEASGGIEPPMRQSGTGSEGTLGFGKGERKRWDGTGRAKADAGGFGADEGGEETVPDSGAMRADEEEGQRGRILPRQEFGKDAKEEEISVIPAGLSSLEKLIYEKYGPVGIKVYSLIDGEKTAEEILNETHISEVKLVEILEFMDEHGIIKLEKPEEKKTGKEETPSAPVEKFKPILEEETDPAAAAVRAQKELLKPPAPIAKKAKTEHPPSDMEEMIDIIPIDVPAVAPLSIAQKAELGATLPLKFGRLGMDMFKLIDGKTDFVEIALQMHCSLFEIDDVLGYFGKKSFVSFAQLPREEIRKKYGDDGFSIYKKYGREGVYLYELIGKEKSLRDIILLSKIEPKRAVEIFVFIHQVLGLDVPFDKDMIYRQLGIK